MLINEAEPESFSLVKKEIHIDITKDLLFQSLNELFSNFSLQIISLSIIIFIIIICEIISHLDLFYRFEFFQGDVISLRLSQFTLRWYSTLYLYNVKQLTNFSFEPPCLWLYCSKSLIFSLSSISWTLPFSYIATSIDLLATLSQNWTLLGFYSCPLR